MFLKRKMIGIWFGNYDINVIMSALQRNNLALVGFNKTQYYNTRKNQWFTLSWRSYRTTEIQSWKTTTVSYSTFLYSYKLSMTLPMGLTGGLSANFHPLQNSNLEECAITIYVDSKLDEPSFIGDTEGFTQYLWGEWRN